MTARTVVAGFAVALAIVGCASDRFHPKDNECKGSGVCKIEVTVVNCQASARPDPLHVFGAHEIHWTIVDSPDYSFAQDGIVFKHDGNHEFTNPRRPQPDMFMWHDRNSVARPDPFEYSIRVMKGGTRCPVHDPGIINHGL